MQLRGLGNSRVPEGTPNNAMQKIARVAVSVDSYIASPLQILTETLRICPCCPEEHRLWRHGSYERTVILPRGEIRTIPVIRLICRHTGVTISLLPDFCLPRRQHGPGVLGIFLEALVFGGRTLMQAMRRARPDAPACHSLPQSLLAGFRHRLHKIRAWLFSRQVRAPDPPITPRPWPLEVATTVSALLSLGPDPAEAFTCASRSLHDCQRVGLA